MPSPSVPKYQHIYAVLTQRILDGEYAPGEKLVPQQELADSFGVTLMTLRQAVLALQRDGLVWAARGKGTFVAERPVDISLGNLSSFAQQMRASGVELRTEILHVDSIAAPDHLKAASALELNTEMCCVTRRRSAGAEPFSLQRSYLAKDLGVVDQDGYEGESLYDAIRDVTGWVVAGAKESLEAVLLSSHDAEILSARAGDPALRSVRVSINQFQDPYLYDEALLVSARCTMTADRTADRLSLRYDVS